MITIHQRYRQTDRRTVRQTTCDRNTALCTEVHRAVKKSVGTKMNDLDVRLKVVSLSRSSKVIDFGTNRKRVYDFLFDLNSNLGPILPRFRHIRAFVRRKPLFQHPTLIRAKISGCSPWSRPVMLGLQRANFPG